MGNRSGIINVYKEVGYTSFDVVARLRGILKIRKIGHTGTLDPDAVGVLPVCVGRATKVCDLLTDKDKEYETTLLLGVETDTQDMTGTVLSSGDVTVSEDQVKEVIRSYTGEISQIPPMYSALKVNGQKLCDLARRGVEVERKPRKVTIYGIEILKMDLPRITMRVRCSRGTYIRTLCHDIGQALGCGGAMESLSRTRVADFRLEDAHTIDEIQTMEQRGELEKILLPVDRLFLSAPAFSVTAEGERLLANGNPIRADRLLPREEEAQKAGNLFREGMAARMYLPDGTFAGIYQWKENKFIPRKMFL